jgi:uncharacterized membrane protein
MIHQTLRAGAYRKLPMHTAFWHFAMACFLGTFITDLTYWKTAEMTWANFSAWLLAAGLLLGVVAALVGLIDWLVGRLVGMHRPTLVFLLGNVIVLALSFLNSLVHSRDAWTSVVPIGIGLSAVVAVLILVTSLVARMSAHARIGGELA